MKRLSLTDSLPAQLIMSFVLVVILTAVTGSLPAIWLILDQLDRQAWSQVDQGSRATRTLYTSKQTELENLASLTAQRPTLHELLAEGNIQGLRNYLLTLQEGASLDLVIICDANQTVLVSTQPSIFEDVCRSWITDGYKHLTTNTQSHVWLAASHAIQSVGTKGNVIIGLTLDDDFTVQMRDQTGLEQTILVNRQPIATSLGIGTEGVDFTKLDPIDAEDEINRSVFEINNQPYYSAWIPLDGNQIEAQVALSVETISATRKRLVWILIGSILTVSAMGSILGAFLARRISQPLVSLAETAEEFRKGDLSSEVVVDARVREVKEVAQALEGARIDLWRTLDNLEREKAWINHLLESIVEGIITLDSEGRITYFSEGAQRITGWDRDRVLNRSCDEVFMLPELDSVFSQNFPLPGSRNKLVVELSEGRHSTLSISQAQLAPSEVSDAEIVLVFRDVSEEVLIHRLLGDFLANIAHEFRTPLSALAASIELLMDQAPDLSDEELQVLLNSLHLGALGLQTLVDNLLESASIEAGRFRVSPRCTDLGSIIAKAVQTMQPLLEKYRQRLVVEIPVSLPEVVADVRRIEQVLINLLSNASKYGPTDAKIKICAKLEDDFVMVKVTDRGPGILRDHREQVFYRFTRPGPVTDSAKVGAGLGLSVVKAIVEAHGGKVGVDDRSGGGAIFWFTLPVAKDHESPNR
jgi:PAS domain S-box-containing protein